MECIKYFKSKSRKPLKTVLKKTKNLLPSVALLVPTVALGNTQNDTNLELTPGKVYNIVNKFQEHNKDNDNTLNFKEYVNYIAESKSITNLQEALNLYNTVNKDTNDDIWLNEFIESEKNNKDIPEKDPDGYLHWTNALALFFALGSVTLAGINCLFQDNKN